jgi:hypothetical protein
MWRNQIGAKIISGFGKFHLVAKSETLRII